MRNHQLAVSLCLTMLPVAWAEEPATTSGQAGELARSPNAEATLDKALIREVIHSHRDDIRGCYEPRQKQKHGLAGKVAVRFNILPSGAVSACSIAESTVTDAELESCILGKVSTWTFPKPAGGGKVTVTYPFLFSSTPGAQSGDLAGVGGLGIGKGGGPIGIGAVDTHGGTTAGHDADWGAGFIGEALFSRIGWMHATQSKLSLSPYCSGTRCNLRKEMSSLCRAFDEGSKRIDSGASWAQAVEPVQRVARGVCCDDVVGMLLSLQRANDADKYTIWCLLGHDEVETDAAVLVRCGWAKCDAFPRFWAQLRGQPESWFPKR